MSTPKEIARGCRRAAAQYRRDAMRAERENARDAMETVLGYFSGPFKTAALRRLYNPRGPYSAASPHPPAPPVFVNERSGDTLRDWRQDGPRLEGDHIVTVISNPSPVAKWLLEGTSKMIPRPYIAAIERDIQPRLDARRRKAIDSALAQLPRG